MRSESVCVSLENGGGNYHYGYTDADAFTIADQAILQKRAIFEIIKDSPFLQKKTPASAGV